MKKLHGLFGGGIILVLAVFACDAFHLQGMASVRQSVCGITPPCCPGHVCRPYQRFDNSRPVAACARSLNTQPLYAPGSRAQGRFCGSSTADRFGQRQISIRGGSRQGLTGRRPTFPGQQTAGQPWGIGGQQPIRQDRSRFDPFRPNPPFGSQFDPSRFSAPGLGNPRRGGQLNTLAPVPQEQRPFVQGQLPFPQGRIGFPQGRSRFAQGQTPFTQGRTGFTQGPRTFSQGRSLISQGRTSFPRGQTQFLQGQESFSRGTQSIGQDLSLIQSQTISGQGFVDGQDFLSQFSEVSQGPSLSLDSQSFTDPSLGFSDLLPLDGAPQPMLVEQPSVSVSRVPSSTSDKSSASEQSSSVQDQSLTITDMTSILAALDNAGSQLMSSEQNEVPGSPVQSSPSGTVDSVPTDMIQTDESLTQLTPDSSAPVESSILLTPVTSNDMLNTAESTGLPKVEEPQLVPAELVPFIPHATSPIGEEAGLVTNELAAVELAQLAAGESAQEIASAAAGSAQATSDGQTVLSVDASTITGDVPTQKISTVSSQEQLPEAVSNSNNNENIL